MRKPVSLHLRALQPPGNGRPTRRTGSARAAIHLMNGRAPLRIFRGWGIFRGLRRAVSEIVVMAVVLALSIVLAHAMLIVMFPV